MHYSVIKVSATEQKLAVHQYGKETPHQIVSTKEDSIEDINPPGLHLKHIRNTVG